MFLLDNITTLIVSLQTDCLASDMADGASYQRQNHIEMFTYILTTNKCGKNKFHFVDVISCKDTQNKTAKNISS